MNIPGPADGIAWVTGASSGIGRELAVQLVKAGWVVAISARRREELESLAAAHPGKIIVAPLDVTDTDAVQTSVKQIETEAGRPIVRAILNAGIYKRDTALSFDIDKFKSQIDVNLLGTANCLAAIMPAMIATRRGQIGIVASLTALLGLPGAVTYSATKAALLSMCQSLKFDLDKANVGISAVLPGFVKTPATAVNEHPMPYLMEVDDAAKAILSGMNAGKFLIAFPDQLALPLKFLRMLPNPIFFKIVSKYTKW